MPRFFFLASTPLIWYNAHMNDVERDKQIDRLSELLIDLFEIDAVYWQGENIVFSLSFRYQRDKSTKLISERLKTAGYRYTLNRTDDQVTIEIDPKKRLYIPPINILLFLLTLISVYIVPIFLRNWMQPSIDSAIAGTMRDLKAGAGIEFTVAMISILFVHEMGHFIAGRRRNIITSWPYFIPAPNIIGTFGAIIKSKSPFQNRRDLIEVGASGPIAGWIVALGWLLYGLSQSAILPVGAFSTKDMFFAMDGESILMRVATYLLVGQAPEGSYYLLTEAAFAGWVGLLITAINMLPIGQLDGGHVVFGLWRKRQHYLGKLAMLGLFGLGFYGGPMWWFFAGFGLFFGVKHPPTLDDNQKLSRTAFWLGIVSLIILIISFTPMPFR